jgi:hypothetical protein
MIARGALLAVVILGPATPLAGQPRPTIWDITLGASAADLPGGFVELACGTNGGPPGRPIASFAEYSVCPPDERGRREVYFRYDDEAEYVARALEQVRAIDYYAGTKIFGIPVILSALFDGSGRVVGLRVVTDPRGAEAGDRNDHWTLANSIMRHYGSDGWACEELPLAAGETPVSSYFVKDSCSKTVDGAVMRVEREYFHRRGHYFIDEFGKAFPESFTSAATFEASVR